MLALFTLSLVYVHFFSWFYSPALDVNFTAATLFFFSPQIPRYILTLHELLAHTPHEHVERNSLDYAKSKLEELSR